MSASTNPKERGLIVCADDFAVHEAASRGIAQLAIQGRLSATSVMSLSPRWSQDVALLQDLRGRIDVGLHLDWTSEFAVEAGHGMSLGHAMLRACLGGFDVAAARGVIERQLDAFEAQWGLAPDYVDGHQHVQQFAGIRQALVQVLVRRYAGRLPYLRLSRMPVGADFKSRVIAVMGASALNFIANDEGITRARGLFGMYDFAGSQSDYAQRMAQWLSQAPSGSIIMCHPALAAEPGDPIGAARLSEFAYLGSEAFAQALCQAQVQVQRGAQALAEAIHPQAPR